MLYQPIYGAYTELFAGLSPEVTEEKNGAWSELTGCTLRKVSADVDPSHPVGSIRPTTQRSAGRTEDGGGGGHGVRREVLGMERGAGTTLCVRRYCTCALHRDYLDVIEYVLNMGAASVVHSDRSNIPHSQYIILAVHQVPLGG